MLQIVNPRNRINNNNKNFKQKPIMKKAKTRLRKNTSQTLALLLIKNETFMELAPQFNILSPFNF